MPSGTMFFDVGKVSVIGRNLRRLRKAKGLSPHAVGKLAGLAHTTVLRLECGDRSNPSIDTIEKLSQVLGVQISELIKDGRAA